MEKISQKRLVNSTSSTTIGSHSNKTGVSPSTNTRYIGTPPNRNYGTPPPLSESYNSSEEEDISEDDLEGQDVNSDDLEGHDMSSDEDDLDSLEGWEIARRGVHLALNNQVEKALNLLKAAASSTTVASDLETRIAAMQSQAGLCFLAFMVSFITCYQH